MHGRPGAGPGGLAADPRAFGRRPAFPTLQWDPCLLEIFPMVPAHHPASILLRDLVREAGGLTPSAYLYGAQFSRESVRAEQQRRLNQMIAEDERSLNRRAAQLATTSTTTNELASARASVEAERVSLDLLRRIQADGRLVLNLHP